MNEDYETGYQPINSDRDDETEDSPNEHIVHIVPDKNRARWNHVDDLDTFFKRIYHYHQSGGFIPIVLENSLGPCFFAYMVIFVIFAITFVDYGILYKNGTENFMDAIRSWQDGFDRIGFVLITALILACIYFIFNLARSAYNIKVFWETKCFYEIALKIPTNELINTTWHEVQRRVLEVQKEQQMCIHKEELTELDIYHRILRSKNYLIAMVNKDVLPIKYNLPFVGPYTYLPLNLLVNLKIMLYWGWWSPFENYWHLRSDYKIYGKRKELANSLGKYIMVIGMINFLFFPFILIWRVLYTLFTYVESIRSDPGSLGMRRWSNYSRLYLRHFNELDHEFKARLNRAYKPAKKYMQLFNSPLLDILAKYAVQFTAPIIVLVFFMTAHDEGVLGVHPLLLIVFVSGLVIGIAKGCLTDENMVQAPDFLLKAVLAQIHYMPDSWRGTAGTYRTRDQFSKLFQYQLVYIIEELLSPLLTPLVLIFWLRHRSLDMVDFLRNFSVEVVGVGDVCSFAQMDIRQHGNPQWVPEDHTEAKKEQQTEGGKTEMSLVHFTLTNPEWKPPRQSLNYVDSLKEQLHRDKGLTRSQAVRENVQTTSIDSLVSLGVPSHTVYSNSLQNSTLPSNTWESSIRPDVVGQTGHGPINKEGPMLNSGNGLLSSLQRSAASSGLYSPDVTGQLDQQTYEYLSTEMSFSALYMHELHTRRVQHPLNSYFDTEDDAQARQLWQTHDTPHQWPARSATSPVSPDASQPYSDSQHIELQPLASDIQGPYGPRTSGQGAGFVSEAIPEEQTDESVYELGESHQDEHKPLINKNW